MAKITLSINDEFYKKMRKYSEIKWSEFVRKIVEKKLMNLNNWIKMTWRMHDSLEMKNFYRIY